MQIETPVYTQVEKALTDTRARIAELEVAPQMQIVNRSQKMLGR